MFSAVEALTYETLLFLSEPAMEAVIVFLMTRIRLALVHRATAVSSELGYVGAVPAVFIAINPMNNSQDTLQAAQSHCSRLLYAATSTLLGPP